MSKHLLVAVSGHGYGHLAQVAPVVNALRRRLPELRLTVQSALPKRLPASRLRDGFQVLEEATDFGMCMGNALDVSPQDSLAAYRDFHSQWDVRLALQVQQLEALRPDLLLADIPYLPLAAARHLGLPAVALCSLNWADILQAYCPAAPDLPDLRRVMLDAYNSARAFLRPEPAMSMPGLTNSRPIGPIAELGRNRRPALARRLALGDDERLVLVSLGGFDLPLAMEDWPTVPGLRWVVPAAWRIQRPDTATIESLAPIPFIDLLRSSDLLLTKPGYGSFVECACNDTAVLYITRRDWPEEPGLSRWLETHGRARGIPRQDLSGGRFIDTLLEVLDQPPPPPPVPRGVEQAAHCLEEHLKPD